MTVMSTAAERDIRSHATATEGDVRPLTASELDLVVGGSGPTGSLPKTVSALALSPALNRCLASSTTPRQRRNYVRPAYPPERPASPNPASHL